MHIRCDVVNNMLIGELQFSSMPSVSRGGRTRSSRITFGFDSKQGAVRLVRVAEVENEAGEGNHGQQLSLCPVFCFLDLPKRGKSM